MLKESKPNLVLAAVGDESLHKHWMPQTRDNYDLGLVYYGENKGYPSDCHHHWKVKGSKYHLLKQVLTKSLSQYQYVWLPDDDIYMTASDINKLFRYMDFFNLSIAQPSIMGWYGVDITLHQKGSLLRYTNFAEIMCPCFSRAALDTCVKHFDENISGWGYEALWNHILNHPRQSIAIIDDIVAIHTRPASSGELYKNCNMKEKDALQEAKNIFIKHNIPWNPDRNFGKLCGGAPEWAVIYHQIPKAMEENIPKSKRCWPPHYEELAKTIRSNNA